MGKFDDEQPTPAKIIELTKKKAQVPENFPCTWISDAVLKLDERPIVKGLIDPGALVVIYGPPSSGKSFFTADLAQHIATGLPWRGRKVTKGLVAYVASEAGSSILKRFVAWRDNRTSEVIERIPLAVLTRGPNLIGGTDYAKLEDQLSELQQQVQLPLQMTVFDTLSRSMPGGDENKTEDMTTVIRSADDLRTKFNSVTSFVHHAGKDVSKGARGSNTLVAAADVVLQIVDCCATVEKVRDGVAGERFPFLLEPIKIGMDADGDPVVTCLLNTSDQPSQTVKKVVIRGIAAIALQALSEEISANGQQLPETSAIHTNGSKAVQLDQWRERFRLRYGEDKDPASRAKAFWRSKDQLLGAYAISISDPWVWIDRHGQT